MDQDDDRTQIVRPGSMAARAAQPGHDDDTDDDDGGDRTQIMQPSQRAQAAARALADARGAARRDSIRSALDLDLSGGDAPPPRAARGGLGLWLGIALLTGAGLLAIAAVSL